MLYPRCPTCGRLLLDKQIPFEDKKNELLNKKLPDSVFTQEISKIAKTLCKHICCRMRLLTYIDKVQVII